MSEAKKLSRTNKDRTAGQQPTLHLDIECLRKHDQTFEVCNVHE